MADLLLRTVGLEPGTGEREEREERGGESTRMLVLGWSPSAKYNVWYASLLRHLGILPSS